MHDGAAAQGHVQTGRPPDPVSPTCSRLCLKGCLISRVWALLPTCLKHTPWLQGFSPSFLFPLTFFSPPQLQGLLLYFTLLTWGLSQTHGPKSSLCWWHHQFLPSPDPFQELQAYQPPTSVPNRRLGACFTGLCSSSYIDTSIQSQTLHLGHVT